MAKKKAETEESVETTTVETTTTFEQETAPKSKKMSRADAESIVKQYGGINGVTVPDELKQARKVLSEKE